MRNLQQEEQDRIQEKQEMPTVENKEGNENESLKELESKSPDRSSSGYSEDDRQPEEESEDLPLALVVDKKKDHDSGHEEDNYSGSSSPQRGFNFNPEVEVKRGQETVKEDQSRIEIQPNVTIAKVRNNNDEAGKIKIKEFAKVNCDDKGLVEQQQQIAFEDLDTVSDVTSEVSSLDAESVLFQRQHHQLMNLGGDHNGQFPCDFCEKVFANKYHLSSHLVSHTGERNFRLVRRNS